MNEDLAAKLAALSAAFPDGPPDAQRTLRLRQLAKMTKVSTPPRPICGFCQKPAIVASYKHAFCADHANGPKTKGLIHPVSSRIS